jgi:hypothetical protein
MFSYLFFVFFVLFVFPLHMILGFVDLVPRFKAGMLYHCNGMLNISKTEIARQYLLKGEFSVSDIAEIVGCSVRTVFRAQEDLRKSSEISTLSLLSERFRSLDARVQVMEELIATMAIAHQRPA